MRQFDLHEFLGYIAPGMLLLVGIRYILPETEKLLPHDGISFGAFGIGVVLAYAAGQLLQTFGNGIETVWWKLWGGMPTDWVRTGKHRIVLPIQAAEVETKAARILGDESFKFSGVNAEGWNSVTRQIRAAIAAAGRAARLDAFIGYYGLCRGLVSSFLILLALNLLLHLHLWRIHAFLVALLLLAIYRMHRFGVRYGQEIFAQFLELPDRKAKGDVS